RAERTFAIPAMQDNTGAVLTATRYHPPAPPRPAWMQVLDVIERDASLQPVAHIYADTATWDSAHERWNLLNGYRVTDVLATTRQPAAAPQPFYQSNINP